MAPAGLHVTDVARQLEIRRAIVPRLAAVLSAWGMLASDLRYEIVRSHIGEASRLDAEEKRAAFRGMEAERRKSERCLPCRGRFACSVQPICASGEQIFEVKVKRVNTLRTKSKWKIRGRTIGRTQQWKKAMVTLHEGSKIEIF